MNKIILQNCLAFISIIDTTSFNMTVRPSMAATFKVVPFGDSLARGHIDRTYEKYREDQSKNSKEDCGETAEKYS